MTYWTQQQALVFCTLVYEKTKNGDCYPALTGGLLYKEGQRKDLDLLFYRGRQRETIDLDKLFASLQELGVEIIGGRDLLFKAKWHGRNIDIFFPEEDKHTLVRDDIKPLRNDRSYRG